MNPVRAGMVASPDGFLWSSHACLSHGKPDDLVTPHELYDGLAREANARRRAYRALFDIPLTSQEIEHIRNCLQKGIALGSEAFSKRLEAMTGQRAGPAILGRPRKEGREPSVGRNHVSRL
jgi:putative transposase